MDRVARVRHQHHVAGRGDRLGHVGEALLRAERRHHLRVRVEAHPEAALVVAGLGAAQAGNALGGGVAVGARLAGGLDELLDDVARRVEIGIAHAEIDDVGAAGSGGGLDPVHLLEDVRRKALDAVEIGHGVGLSGVAELILPRGCVGGEEPACLPSTRSRADLKINIARPRRDRGGTITPPGWARAPARHSWPPLPPRALWTRCGCVRLPARPAGRSVRPNCGRG
ncbi:hypothetical protein M2437_003649 [Methylorubrum pseudosasae]|nr:hypothetical protein [Methylorubrum pseudosasae]